MSKTKPKISKATFVKTLQNIQKHLSEEEAFSDSIAKYFSCYPPVRERDYALTAIFQVLKEIIDPYDYVLWWLFEDVEKKVWIDDKELDVSTPEKLYDFLTNY